MSLVLDTGTMKYRENPNQPWRPLVIKAGMNWESMADTYDPDNGTYEVGQYVLEEGMMYRCISEITTPEAWTPAHWTSVNVGDELSSFIIISDDQPTDETNKIWIAETTAPFGVQVPTMDDHIALENTLTQLETSHDAVEDAIAYVQDGDTASRTYTAGQFVYLKNHATLPEGLYTVNQNDSIPQGNSVTGHLTEDPSGGLNSLKASLTRPKIVTEQDYHADYTYNTWVSHSKTFSTLSSIENAFISMNGGWVTSAPHEVCITSISNNTVNYAGKGMWSGGVSGISVVITAIGT